MMQARAVAILLLALTVEPPPAPAQGLGDASARERARRAKQAAGADRSGKSFSNDDLERGRPKGSSPSKKSGASAAPSEPAPSEPAHLSESETASSPEHGEPAPPPAEQAAPDEPDIPALEARIKLLQDKLNPMSGTYIFGPFGSGDPTEEPRTREELQRLEAELVQAREAAARTPAPAQVESEPAQY